MKVRAALIVGAIAASVTLPPDAIAADPLPNLRAYAPFEIAAGSTDRYFPGGTGAVRFAIRVGNLGDAPLALLGVPQPVASAIATVQCTSWAAAACIAWEDVGTFTWHVHHTAHWHMPDFFAFELRTLREDRSPDMTPAGTVVTGARSAVCLADLEQLQADGTPVTAYFACTSESQGLSPGWAYTLYSHVDEQFLPLDTVEDGDYALVVSVNPTRRFMESNYDDNAAFRRIRISDGARQVEVIQ